MRGLCGVRYQCFAFVRSYHCYEIQFMRFAFCCILFISTLPCAYVRTSCTVSRLIASCKLSSRPIMMISPLATYNRVALISRDECLRDSLHDPEYPPSWILFYAAYAYVARKESARKPTAAVPQNERVSRKMLTASSSRGTVKRLKMRETHDHV